MFSLSQSPSGMRCLVLKPPTYDQRWYLKRALNANHIEDRFIEKNKRLGLFKCDSADYLLIEFWTGTEMEVKKYLDFLNDNFSREVLRWRQLMG